MKEFFKEMTREFLTVTVLVNLVIFVLGSLFEPDARFGYDAFLAPFLYAGLSLIPSALLYSTKEISTSRLIIKNILLLIIIEAVVFTFGFGYEKLAQTEPIMVISIGISIAAVFILVHIIQWWTSSKEAAQMTDLLKNFQSQPD